MGTRQKNEVESFWIAGTVRAPWIWMGEGCEAIEKAIDRAIAVQCAEQVGGLEEGLRRAVAYSQERVQFGKPIGSFQAIKHKAANMFVHLETSRSSLYYAAMAIDQDMPDVKAAVSSAKAMCSEAFLEVAKEAIQIHGGIGYTDECDTHFFISGRVWRTSPTATRNTTANATPARRGLVRRLKLWARFASAARHSLAGR